MQERDQKQSRFIIHHKIRSVPTAIFMSDNSPSTNCVYCNESYTPSFCKKFNTLNARKDVLKSSGCCFICLRKGHLAVNCRSGRSVITAKADTMAVFVDKESP